MIRATPSDRELKFQPRTCASFFLPRRREFLLSRNLLRTLRVSVEGWVGGREEGDRHDREPVQIRAAQDGWIAVVD